MDSVPLYPNGVTINKAALCDGAVDGELQEDLLGHVHLNMSKVVLGEAGLSLFGADLVVSVFVARFVESNSFTGQSASGISKRSPGVITVTISISRVRSGVGSSISPGVSTTIAATVTIVVLVVCSCVISVARISYSVDMRTTVRTPDSCAVVDFLVCWSSGVRAALSPLVLPSVDPAPVVLIPSAAS